MDQNARKSRPSLSSFSPLWFSIRLARRKTRNSSQHGRRTWRSQSWSPRSRTRPGWRSPSLRTRYQWDRCPSDHRNDRVCARKYFEHCFISSSLGLVAGSRTIVSSLFGENHRRRYRECQRHYHPYRHVFLRVDYRGCHPWYGLYGMFLARLASAVGGVQQQVLQSRW